MQTQSQLARIEESHFAKMLDAYDTSLIEGEKIARIVSEVADEYIVDGSHLFEIAECDIDTFFDKLAFVLKQHGDDRTESLIDFKYWLIDQAKQMNNVQLEAASLLQQESFYSDMD